MAEIHRCLQHWHEKFPHLCVTYDEAMSYSINHPDLVTVGETLCASSLVMNVEDVQAILTTFLVDFEKLNVLLLLYIPGQPSAKWCSLPSLLKEYGVCLPHEDQIFLGNKVIFPSHGDQIHVEQLVNPMNPSTTGEFQPRQNIYLRLDRKVTLKELSIAVERISIFQEPLREHLKMFIFFKLKKSVLVDKYLHYYLQKQHMDKEVVSLPSLCAAKTAMDVALQSLVEALKKTSGLILKIISGSATYSEILAEDTSLLEQLKIENEFAIFSGYRSILKLSIASEGLEELKSMLELFQYTTHINNIKLACEQYQLKNCLDDPGMKDLLNIMEECKTEEDRLKMTPHRASKKMRMVKNILCVEESTSSKCLDIFAAVTDSAAFYKFLKDNQFYGEKGQENFLQQYRLITAQLQHEEYDEQVLNHLFAAVKVISPFLEAKSLKDLMLRVIALNAINSLKHLKTVNTNLNLIQLWFSRAEVSYYGCISSFYTFCYREIM